MSKTTGSRNTPANTGINKPVNFLARIIRDAKSTGLSPNATKSEWSPSKAPPLLRSADTDVVSESHKQFNTDSLEDNLSPINTQTNSSLENLSTDKPVEPIDVVDRVEETESEQLIKVSDDESLARKDILPTEQFDNRQPRSDSRE